MTHQDHEVPRVGVGVLVRRGNELLLVLRRNVHGDGTWSTPGGHLEFGEAPEDCAVREVREEAGVEIEGVRFLGVTNDVFEAEGRHYITVWMEASYLSGTASVVAEHEIAEVMWCERDSLPANLFLSLRHLVDGQGYGVDSGGQGRLRNGQPPREAMRRESPRLSRDLGLVLAAWLLSLGIDFFLHAGALAQLYAQQSAFLLSPQAAFARIPLGYASFLVLTLGLWWLCSALEVRGARRGLTLGLVTGGIVWGGLLLGLYSISTAPVDLLVGWWLGQTVELGAAGAVIGAGKGVARRRRIYLWIALVVLALVVATVVIQALGWAPAMETVGERITATTRWPA